MGGDANYIVPNHRFFFLTSRFKTIQNLKTIKNRETEFLGFKTGTGSFEPSNCIRVHVRVGKWKILVVLQLHIIKGQRLPVPVRLVQDRLREKEPYSRQRVRVKYSCSTQSSAICPIGARAAAHLFHVTTVSAQRQFAIFGTGKNSTPFSEVLES
jgi:hypothetical protein